MLKHESTAQIGDVIKAFDFKPMPEEMKADYPDQYMIGKVVDKGMIKHPHLNCDLFKGYTIEITESTNPELIGELGYVPFETDMMEYDERVEWVA